MQSRHHEIIWCIQCFYFCPFYKQMRVHVLHKRTQIDINLSLLCTVLSVTAYTMRENKTKQLIITIAMVYYQPPEISGSS